MLIIRSVFLLQCSIYSVYNEERNLLRLRAWEQRNQETSQQAKELNPENVPLFGKPYKVKTTLGSWQTSSDKLLTHSHVNSSVDSNRASNVLVIKDAYFQLLILSVAFKAQYA